MQLKITNIHGQIGIRKNDAVLSIRQPRADLEITTHPAEAEIKTDQIKVKIDQKQCFSEAGLKDVFELTRDFANKGMQDVLEGIGRIVDEGNRMAQIDNKADPFVEIATNKSLPEPAPVNITFIPQSRPKIDVEGGVNIKWKAGSVDMKSRINSPEITATPHSMEIYLAQRPDFHFEFVGNNVDVWR